MRGAERRRRVEAYFAELQTLAADAPKDIQERLGAFVAELGRGLQAFAHDPQEAEHQFRDWADHASLVWQVALLASKKGGSGTDADLRAARRLLARNAPTSRIRSDFATPDDVALVAFGA